MIVIYRMCGKPSTNPSPWSQEDKFNLNKVCLKSFVEAFREVKPEMVFLMDYCGKGYSNMLEEIVPFKYLVETLGVGINATMVRAYEIADAVESDYILFQECDYLYRPGTGKLLLEAIKELGLVSPYDHRNFYIDKSIHSATCDVRLVDDRHFRTTERNTMTWGCHTNLVKENYEMLVSYGYLDNEVWRELEYAGYRLWVPIPSIATHCVKDYLSPGVDWEKIWLMYQ